MEGFEPQTDQSEIVKLSTAPRGTRRHSAVEELMFIVRWFFLEFVLALWAHPAPGISFLFHPKCKKKHKNKPRLRNFGLYTSRLQTFKMEQILPQHVDLLLLPWLKVYRKEPSAFINDEHSRECTMFHFGIYRHSRLHVSGSSGYPAPDRPFVYTYPGQMYAIRSNTVRYPERFENDFKSGQPGCLDPFSPSVNGVPGYPDRFLIQFSMAKKNSNRLFTCRACLLSGAFRWIFVFDFLYFHSLPPVSSKTIFRQMDTGIGNFAKFRRTPNSLQERPFGSSNWRFNHWRIRKQELSLIGLPQESFFAWCWLAHATCSETRKKGSFNFHEWHTENPERYRAARQLWPSKLGRKSCWYRIAHACRTTAPDIWIRVNASHLPGCLLPGYPDTLLSVYV